MKQPRTFHTYTKSLFFSNSTHFLHENKIKKQRKLFIFNLTIFIFQTFYIFSLLLRFSERERETEEEKKFESLFFFIEPVI